MTFGDLLKRFRERRQLTLRELGTLSGVDHGYIHNLETDKKDNPSLEILIPLTKSLKLSNREVAVWYALLEYSAPDDLVDYVLLHHETAISDFKLLSSMCAVEVEPQSHSIWEKLLKQISDLRRTVESL